MAAMGGFGGGMGGSHAEVCGAISGAALVLSLLIPTRTARTGPERRRCTQK